MAAIHGFEAHPTLQAPIATKLTASMSPRHGTSYGARSPQSEGSTVPLSQSPHPTLSASDIFERSVAAPDSPCPQEMALHHTQENLIPPVLDASAEAITNGTIELDQVKVVSLSQSPHLHCDSFDDEDVRDDHSESFYPENDDKAPPQRRLSFISFNDVIHAEETAPSNGATGDMSSPNQLHTETRSLEEVIRNGSSSNQPDDPLHHVRY